MTKHLQKFTAVLLAVIMTLGVFAVVPFTASAATSITLAQLQAKYPHGKYWNGGNANSYTSSPCTHHGSGRCSYNGSCGCNTFKGHCIQCMGFAYQLAYLVYGGDPYVNRKKNESSSALNSLKAGDVVRYGNHSIFVTAVNGNTVTYADCNSDGHCKIRWNQTISKSTLKSTFKYVDPAPYAWNPGPHTHSYTTTEFEAAHPHRVYEKCSCGATRYTGATKFVSTCSSCMTKDSRYPTGFKCRTISTSKVKCYNDVNFSSSPGYIYPEDDCVITALYSNGRVQCKCPWSGGSTKTVYVNKSVFINSSTTPKKMTAPKHAKTYLRTDMSKNIGWIDKGDAITIVATSGNKTQIIYPADGGKRCAWVYTSDLQQKYTVTYNANGGSGAPGKQTKNHGTALTLSSTKPTRTGYKFSGWATGSSATSAKYQPGGKFTTEANTTLYAVWTPNKLTVTFNANGGTVDTSKFKLVKNVIYTKDDNKARTQSWTYDLPKENGLVNASSFGLTKTGYIFKGWGTTPTGGTIYNQSNSKLIPSQINSKIKTGNCSTTLYAIWQTKTYTVTYNANNGTGAPSKQMKTHGTALTLSSTKPTRTGYKFSGWSIDSSATSAKYQPGDKFTTDASTTLYAVWEKNPVMVTKIEIASQPSKTTYQFGDSLNTAGLSIKVTYSDNSTQTITSGFSISGFESNTAGVKKVTISYENKITSFTVTVQNKPVPAADNNYREEFINALLESEDEWYVGVGNQSTLEFTDLNFDGKLEFIMQYDYNAYAYYYFENNKINFFHGFNHTLSGYYDKYNEKYIMLGHNYINGGNGDWWRGDFVLEFDGKSYYSNYYSSILHNYNLNTNEEEYRYYSGANENEDDYVKGLNEISESEYNRINEEKLKNLVNINMKSEYILCSDWEKYSNSEKRQALEKAYDSFNYDDTTNQSPTDPTDPTNPTKPTEPTDSTDPTEQSVPTVPNNPTQPNEPNNPDDPANPNPDNTSKPSLGDIDGDGEISVNDVTDIQKYIVQLKPFTDEQMKFADVDKNGKIDVYDVTLLQKVIVKIAVI